ncbi:MAG: hypothetical protein NC041_06830 [Bacteroides sp.]|nr:hypothetical protein [Prevotella sp.]MCM1407011.1 hypothetical protein [Treponema brennaborense]MCM1470162.1 hypothetical protein [Bacteroides sp.]
MRGAFSGNILKVHAELLGKEYFMNCKFHPTAEAVTTCANCGAGICSSCNKEAFFKTKNGQPHCIECSLKEAEENVDSEKKFLKGIKRELIFSTIFFVLAILCFIPSIVEGKGDTAGVLIGILFWLLSGLIQTRGHENNKGSIKSIIWSNTDQGKFSFSKIIFYIFAAPVMLIKNFIEYPKSKACYQLDIQEYEKIKAAYANAKR